MPAGIEQSRTFDAHVLNALLQFLQLLQCTNQIFFVAEDANQILHGFLQIAMDLVRTFTVLALEGSQHLSRAFFDLPGIYGRSLDGLCVFGGGQAGAAAEDEQIRKRIAAQAVRAMKSACSFAWSKQ